MDEAAQTFNLPVEDSEEYDTLAGYMFSRLGKRPRVGDTIDLDGFKLEIAEINRLSIRRIRLQVPDNTELINQAV